MSSQPDEQGINQWLNVDQFPEHLQKCARPVPKLMHGADERFRYWFQRFKIWEKYDKGVWMTEDAWFGVTPEPIAKYSCPCPIKCD
jgi:trimethylguanosine synthase